MKKKGIKPTKGPKEGSDRGGRRGERRDPGSHRRAVFHRGGSGWDHMLLSQEMIIVDLDKSSSLLGWGGCQGQKPALIAKSKSVYGNKNKIQML